MSAAPECPTCHAALDGRALVTRVTRFSPELGGVHTTTCAACGTALECRVRADVVEVGYTYWAGSMHFSPEITVPCPDVRADRDGTIELEGARVFPRD